MLFSLQWLRSLCPFDQDAEAIVRRLTGRGLTVDSVTTFDEDHVLDIDVPANRPDCLGHLGVARELSAATGTALAEPPEMPAGEGDSVESSATIAIDDPERCRRFTATLVRDVEIRPSPEWVARRLEACGLRAINNVVDASNLVMLETGNPVHFYDYERVADATLRARRAEAGERLTTLDGVERRLREDMLVIADGSGASGVAGVMGGADSEIHDGTHHVLIEAAWFDPISVRKTSSRLGLKTDASFRFERGVDPEGVLAAQRLAVRLLSELAGGRVAPGMIDVEPVPYEAPQLSLRSSRLPRLLGYDPGADAAFAALSALGLSPVRSKSDRIDVTVPSWRVDLGREIDLVEEVARHVGYDRIPMTTDGVPTRIVGEPREPIENRVRDYLVAQGFHETYGYAMIGAQDDAPFVPEDLPEGWRLSNPISEAQSRLRRSLLPGLLKALDLNLRRGVEDVRLFEIGPVFLRSQHAETPSEPMRVGLVWTGAARPRHWSEPVQPVAWFDLAGLIDGLLERVRPRTEIRRQGCERPGFHPAHTACWRTASGEMLAWAGRLHPDLAGDLAAAPWVAELDLGRIVVLPDAVHRFEPIPKLTEITRDLAVVLRPGLDYATILEAFRGIDPPASVSFEAVDRYEGPPLAEGEASLTVRFRLRPEDAALTETEIERYRTALVEVLERDLGVGIRGD
jgi:phenylalanyl-tRNA synthetase beta chain